MSLSLDPKTTALLVMDYQTAIVENYATDKDGLLARTTSLLAAARRTGMTVIYVVVGFRAGHPEISPRNMTFSAIRQTGFFGPGAPGVEIHPAVAPLERDVVVVKHRVGAFLGTDLEMVLRAGGIDTLVMAGIATSGVVLSTLRHAADADFRIVVAGDCCSDRDAEVHRVLLEKVFPRQAQVASAGEILQALP
ncbi:MAG TPA: isochorismatase family cysteine hydrolase [Rhizomicrobium sp.]|jgi:nicotinamidase-related amidase|nr:isochorismatase family cysteine hydrolase [Rhizomicrobium sp.]